MRVRWKIRVKKEGSPSKPETSRAVERELVEREVKARKARYRVSKGVKYDVSAEVIGKPAVIKETVIQDCEPYTEQVPEGFEDIVIDCLESEIQDYGDVKYYRSEYGKVKVAKNAEYYER
jgi:hypothetical protein